tara:strand:+ start:7510 stop:11436 length:3927 start_codon:yes stop_codon:yes gene_type:complete
MLTSSLLLLAALQQAPVQLDLPAGLPERFQTTLELKGRRVDLVLKRRSLRGEGFILQNTEGPIEKIPPSRTYFGFVDGLPGATVAASLEPRGLLASVFMPDDSIWRLSPNETYGNGWHQIAKAPPIPMEMCGVDGQTWSANSTGPSGRAASVPPPTGGGLFVSPFPWDWNMRKSRVAFDATYDYWLREGQTVAGVTAGVEYQLAENNLVCSRDAMVSYELTGIVIRQAQYYVGTTSGALLDEFRIEWDNNQGHIPRESAVVLEDYQGDGIAGLAWVGTLGGGHAYAGLYWDRGYSPGIIAHEIGHNWGCGHIDCWPWGGSAMCGSWLLYGPGSTDLIQSRASWLNLPIIPPYADAVRPYADPDWTATDAQADLLVDALDNDYDANMEHIHVSGTDPVSEQGGTVSIASGVGPGGRDLLLYEPDRTRVGNYTDTFWYAASDSGGNEHWTPVTIDVTDRKMVAEWAFEEGAGDLVEDTSGSNNQGRIHGPSLLAETADPSIVLDCDTWGWSPSRNLFDNSTGTEFASANQGVVSTNLTRDPLDGTWLEMAFSAPTDIAGIRFMDRANSGDWLSSFRLWFSTDNVFDLNDPWMDISVTSHTELVDYPFDPVNAQFVRLEVTAQDNPNSNSHSLGGCELAFLFETGLTEFSPPSITLSSNALAGFPSSNLVDEDSSTEFISNNQGTVGSPLTQDPSNGTWVEFDFGATLDIGGVQFLDRLDNAAWTKESRLWFSNSPGFSSSNPVKVLNHANQAAKQVLPFAVQQGRYLRWEISKKEMLSWKNSLGGSELTFLTDINNNPGFNRVPGLHGDCLEVTGSTQVSAENATDVPSSANAPFTINLFVNPSTSLSDGTLLGGFGSPLESPSNQRMFEIVGGSVRFAGLDTAWPLPLSSWTMLTASHDGSLLSVYADGVEIGNWSHTFSASSNELHLLAKNPNFPDARFLGKLDEFAVWDWGMSGVEVSELLSGGAAHGPLPFDTQALVSTSPQLEWASGHNSPLHNIYFGTNFQSVRNADTSSPEFLTQQGSNQITLNNLQDLTWYFWRVDEVYPNGDTIPGRVWRFRTELPWTTTVYEGFNDGNDGDHLDGLAGGTAFAAPWVVPAYNGYKHRTGSIGAYPSNLPLSEADGFFERKAVSNLSMEGGRDLDQTQVNVDLAGDALYYLSFAVKLEGNEQGMTAMAGIKDPASGNTLLVGSEAGKWAISGSTGDITGIAAAKGRTQFVVLRIQAKGQNVDQCWMKVYDTLSETVHQSDSLLSGMGSGTNEWDLISPGLQSSGNFTQLFIRAGGSKTYSTSKVYLDEIRIGRTWTDVTGL